MRRSQDEIAKIVGKSRSHIANMMRLTKLPPEVQALIAELAEKGMGVVLISSELEEVVEGSDTVLVLRDGAALGSLFGDEISEDAIMNMIAGAAAEETEVTAP